MGVPMKVTAWLSSPLAGDPPMLDGLLEAVAARNAASIAATWPATGDPLRHKGPVEAQPTRSTPAPPPGLLPIPIDRRDCCGWPVALCSSPVLPPCQETVERIAKRVDTGTIGPRMAETGQQSIHHGSGPLKAYYLPLRVRPVPRIAWFCVAHGSTYGRGSERRSPAGTLRQLLRRVESLGDARRAGYGTVARWEVEEWPEDWSWFAPSESGPVLMRPLPAAAELPAGCAGWRKSYGSVCPPYWHPDRQIEMVEPC